MTLRDARSTSVAICVFFKPEIKSPSQWPGAARSSTSGGRSDMDTASIIWQRGCPTVVHVFPLRMVRLLRRREINSRFKTPRPWMN